MGCIRRMSHVHSVASMYPSHITYTVEYRCCSLRSLILEPWIPTFLVWKEAFKLFFEGHLAMPIAVSSADFYAKVGMPSAQG